MLDFICLGPTPLHCQSDLLWNMIMAKVMRTIDLAVSRQAVWTPGLWFSLRVGGGGRGVFPPIQKAIFVICC